LRGGRHVEPYAEPAAADQNTAIEPAKVIQLLGADGALDQRGRMILMIIVGVSRSQCLATVRFPFLAQHYAGGWLGGSAAVAFRGDRGV